MHEKNKEQKTKTTSWSLPSKYMSILSETYNYKKQMRLTRECQSTKTFKSRATHDGRNSQAYVRKRHVHWDQEKSTTNCKTTTTSWICANEGLDKVKSLFVYECNDTRVCPWERYFLDLLFMYMGVTIEINFFVLCFFFLYFFLRSHWFVRK